ncbi:unnamed protein product, partial [Staurois parvus]
MGPPVPTPHAACQASSLSWVPVRPPHCCCPGGPHTLSHVCHFQVSSHCWWVPFCHRVLQDGLPLCCPRNLPWWAPRTGLLMAAARPSKLSWAPVTASSCCCQVQSAVMGPVRPPILLLSSTATLWLHH